MIFLGIDPGLTGALAALDDQGVVKGVWDTPTLVTRSGVRERREYDLAQMRGLLAQWSPWIHEFLVQAGGKNPNPVSCRCALELVGPMPKQGVVSMWRMGFGVGVWEGLLAALRIPVERVSPQRWKGIMLDGLPKGKDASLYRAKSLWPDQVDKLSLKKHEGRAEALLIAEWMRRTWHGRAFSTP